MNRKSPVGMRGTALTTVILAGCGISTPGTTSTSGTGALLTVWDVAAAPTDTMGGMVGMGDMPAAVDVARTELRDGENPEATALAQRIIDAQQAEIATMKQLLTTV